MQLEIFLWNIDISNFLLLLFTHNYIFNFGNFGLLFIYTLLIDNPLLLAFNIFCIFYRVTSILICSLGSVLVYIILISLKGVHKPVANEPIILIYKLNILLS